MSRSKKNEPTCVIPKASMHINDHMLLLSKQYDMLGRFMRIETEALVEGDMRNVVEARKRVLMQYKEIGDQLRSMMHDLE